MSICSVFDKNLSDMVVFEVRLSFYMDLVVFRVDFEEDQDLLRYTDIT